jgi:hypothetical protein
MANKRNFLAAIRHALQRDKSQRWSEDELLLKKPELRTGMLDRGKMRTGLKGRGPTTTKFMRGTRRTSEAESIWNGILY